MKKITVLTSLLILFSAGCQNTNHKTQLEATSSNQTEVSQVKQESSAEQSGEQVDSALTETIEPTVATATESTTEMSVETEAAVEEVASQSQTENQSQVNDAQATRETLVNILNARAEELAAIPDEDILMARREAERVGGDPSYSYRWLTERYPSLTPLEQL